MIASDSSGQTRVLWSALAPVATDLNIFSTESDILVLAIGEAIIELTLHCGEEAQIGRRHVSNSVQPKIDLAPYQASVLGMSRIHASIRHDRAGWWLTDLGSSNGTWVNTERIAPFIPHRLGGVNEIWLAKLDLRILIPAVADS